MPGTHKKGTNDADSDGKKGGSLPEVVEPVAVSAGKVEPVVKARDFGAEIDGLKDLMRRNGWTV